MSNERNFFALYNSIYKDLNLLKDKMNNIDKVNQNPKGEDINIEENIMKLLPEIFVTDVYTDNDVLYITKFNTKTKTSTTHSVNILTKNDSQVDTEFDSLNTSLNSEPLISFNLEQKEFEFKQNESYSDVNKVENSGSNFDPNSGSKSMESKLESNKTEEIYEFKPDFNNMMVSDSESNKMEGIDESQSESSNIDPKLESNKTEEISESIHGTDPISGPELQQNSNNNNNNNNMNQNSEQESEPQHKEYVHELTKGYITVEQVAEEINKIYKLNPLNRERLYNQI